MQPHHPNDRCTPYGDLICICPRVHRSDASYPPPPTPQSLQVHSASLFAYKCVVSAPVQSCRGHITRQRGRSRSFVQANDMPKRNLERDPREIRFTGIVMTNEGSVLVRITRQVKQEFFWGVKIKALSKDPPWETSLRRLYLCLRKREQRELQIRISEVLSWKLKILVVEMKLLLEQRLRAKNKNLSHTCVSESRVTFVRSRLLARVRRYSHESTTESTVLLLGSFVSPECECRCRVHRLRNDTVWQDIHVKFRDVVGYLVSARAGREGGGGGDAGVWIRRKRERTHSQKNALKCKPDPCEIRGPTTVPPTMTMPDRTFRAIRPDIHAARGMEPSFFLLSAERMILYNPVDHFDVK